MTAGSTRTCWPMWCALTGADFAHWSGTPSRPPCCGPRSAPAVTWSPTCSPSPTSSALIYGSCSKPPQAVSPKSTPTSACDSWNGQIQTLAHRIAEHKLRVHPDRAVVASLPRSGTVRSARLELRRRLPPREPLGRPALPTSPRQRPRPPHAVRILARLDPRHLALMAGQHPLRPSPAPGTPKQCSTKINGRRLDTGQFIGPSPLPSASRPVPR